MADPRITNEAGPKRIQRKRTKGWRMPEGAIYVGRGTKWGNPFKFGEAQVRTPGEDGVTPWEHEGRLHKTSGTSEAFHHSDKVPGTNHYRVTWHQVENATREQCVEMYRQRLMRTDVSNVGWGEPLGVVRAELAGKDLACWCQLDQPCHADVLLEIANGGGNRG